MDDVSMRVLDMGRLDADGKKANGDTAYGAS